MTTVPNTSEHRAYFDPENPAAVWHFDTPTDAPALADDGARYDCEACGFWITDPTGDVDGFNAAVDDHEEMHRRLDEDERLAATAPPAASFAPSWAERTDEWSVEADRETLWTCHSAKEPTPPGVRADVELIRADTWRAGVLTPGVPAVTVHADGAEHLDADAAMALALALATAAGRLRYIAGGGSDA